jgi:hypothetical protein
VVHIVVSTMMRDWAFPERYPETGLDIRELTVATGAVRPLCRGRLEPRESHADFGAADCMRTVSPGKPFSRHASYSGCPARRCCRRTEAGAPRSCARVARQSV